jgi:dethiobiotin synthetase
MNDHTFPTGFFITGSDTDVGKTHVACHIIKQLKPQLESLKVRKPVESGCALIDGKYFASDGDMLFRCNDRHEDMKTVTPYRFQAALAPNQAARLENKKITLAQLKQAVLNNIETQNFLLVEGAGGFYSPIAEDGLNADLARMLGLEMIIVIEDRVGAINQALLTVRAVESAGLTIRALILNQKSPQHTDAENLAEISQRVGCRVLACPYRQTPDDFQLLG